MTARAILVLVLLALAAAVPTAAAGIAATPNRVDLVDVEPGRDLARNLTVRNLGNATADVRIVVDAVGGETVEVVPATLRIAPGASDRVDYLVRVPANASGGRHDVRLLVVENGASPVGRHAVAESGVLVPVVYAVRNLKIGALDVADGAVGDVLNATILVQNFLGAPARADVAIEVVASTGRVVARWNATTGVLAPDETAPLRAEFVVDAPAGEYLVRAVARSGANESNAGTDVLRLGEKRLDVSAVRARGARGVAGLAVTVTNAGTVPLDGVVTFQIRDANGVVVREIVADGVRLAPGESREVLVEATLDSGRYSATAVVAWPGGVAAPPAALEETTLRVRAAPAAVLGSVFASAPAVALIGLPLLLLGAAVVAARPAWRRMRARARPRLRAPVRPTSAAARALPLDDFLGRLSAEREILVVDAGSVDVDPDRLVAVAGLGAGARLVAHASGPRVAARTAVMRSVGVDAHGHATREAAVAAIARDARAAGGAGALVVLASHDPSLALLVLTLREGGARVEILGSADELPLDLLDAADGVRLA